ncbi:hypothetical protein IFM89_006396 [Coptis chinensis]|uniref:DUF7950 domain-containing protein n=1 Tax=Coptis chinensis TaxID=261450 RepID=A0A835LTK2_9MAGN|nr:hypothetical protein IFM89_006396 [Coptis chinensis]
MEEDKDTQETPTRGNEWEVVSLTASAYAAAPVWALVILRMVIFGYGCVSKEILGQETTIMLSSPNEDQSEGTSNSTTTQQQQQQQQHKKSSTKRREILEGKNRSGSDPSAREMVTLTLSLLPESPGNKGTPVRPSRSDLNDLTATRASKNVLSDQTVVMQHGVRSVGSLVIVESMEGVWNHDPAKRTIDLENDTCPGFLSNGCNSVLWTNQAYKMMVGHDHEMVWLVMKERFPSMCWAFVCRVRLQYKAKNGKKSMIVPCDVWRMAGGDLAWRLDVQAALSLGR